MKIKNKIILILFSILICGCGNNTIKTAPIKTAYTDGFEVVIIRNGNIKQANSYKLAEAEKLISSNAKNRLTISIDKLENLQKAIEHKQNGTGSYPFVRINVTKENTSKIIDLSFHYSISTYHYCYKIENKKIIPLWSSYHNLNNYKKTTYK